ncbi:cell division protein FtsL [Streptomyces paludis]|uniref:Cell division protein FtsL n=2 Tax=Streptomyces paludis TaxID=2282738 RepID=A0A345I0D0_9ACTN|nr:cell division protein FtsL [Streptomyces paludis]
MPAGNSSAARTPFVLLVVLILGGGLITLLLLNSALNEGSFQLSALKKRTTDLTDEEQALQRDVDDYSAPYALERRARELGMVPGGSPAFLNADGTVRGVPEPAAPRSADPASAATTAAGQPSTMEESAPVPAPDPAPSPSPALSVTPSAPPAPVPSPSAGASETPAPTTSGR